MSRLTHQDILDIRRTRGASVLLFITDRCPVGCAHCSVDSRPDSPRITDFPLFEGIVEGIAGLPDVPMVGISGGEPFVERRGLALAVRRITEAGKEAVIYTSGFWARTEQAPPWVDEVLERCTAIYLSTDAHHVAGQGPERFGNAARVIAGHGLPIIVQAIDEGDTLEWTRGALASALGPRWEDHAEVVPTQGLPHGRGAQLYTLDQRRTGREFGPCGFVDSTVVRYDGRVTVCCNESVIMGAGPPGLSRNCTDAAEVLQAVEDFRRDDFFRLLGSIGPGALTALPEYRDLADRRFSSICGLCWEMTKRRVPGNDPRLAALAALTS